VSFAYVAALHELSKWDQQSVLCRERERDKISLLLTGRSGGRAVQVDGLRNNDTTTRLNSRPLRHPLLHASNAVLEARSDDGCGEAEAMINAW
jgi:hypothetical protein